MELVDAICSNPHARSVVEYSLTPCFRRSYSTIFKAINEMKWDDLHIARLVTPYLPRPKNRPYWLLGSDVTPQPRPFARTLADRGMVHQPNMVIRLRGTRVLYRQFVPDPDEPQSGAGRPQHYGERFALQDPDTWHEPDEVVTLWERSRRGQWYRVEIRAWYNMLMPGKNKPYRIPMYRYPFTLVQVVRYDDKGNLACKRPLWLLAIGEYRYELSAQEIYQAYGRRYDLEHSLVQRDFGRIIRQIGTPAQPPKPRFISPGRPKGMKFPPRPRQKVVVKSQQVAKPP